MFLALGASEVDCELQYGQLRKKKKIGEAIRRKETGVDADSRFCFNEWPFITSMAMIVLAGFGGTHVTTDLTTQS